MPDKKIELAEKQRKANEAFAARVDQGRCEDIDRDKLQIKVLQEKVRKHEQNQRKQKMIDANLQCGKVCGICNETEEVMTQVHKDYWFWLCSKCEGPVGDKGGRWVRIKNLEMTPKTKEKYKYRELVGRVVGNTGRGGVKIMFPIFGWEKKDVMIFAVDEYEVLREHENDKITVGQHVRIPSKVQRDKLGNAVAPFVKQCKGKAATVEVLKDAQNNGTGKAIKIDGKDAIDFSTLSKPQLLNLISLLEWVKDGEAVEARDNFDKEGDEDEDTKAHVEHRCKSKVGHRPASSSKSDIGSDSRTDSGVEDKSEDDGESEADSREEDPNSDNEYGNENGLDDADHSSECDSLVGGDESNSESRRVSKSVNDASRGRIDDEGEPRASQSKTRKGNSNSSQSSDGHQRKKTRKGEDSDAQDSDSSSTSRRAKKPKNSNGRRSRSEDSSDQAPKSKTRRR